MSTQPLVQIGGPDIEQAIQQRLAEERARLEHEGGTGRREVHHFKRPEERPFTADQRGHTTLLFGGLTWKHEKLVHGALEGLGYNAEAVPTPNVSAFQTGKEYGNNGQCNPTYFTVGNLVQYLQNLEEQGLTKQEIIDRYVFFTAGACGPCRFGMYEAEYRLALRNSGFDGFRVLLFQQSGGLSQSDAEAGLEMNLDFFLGILNALNCGDVLNEVAYAIRPYEVNAGETDGKLDEAMDYMHEVFRKKQPWKLNGSLGKYLGSFSDTAEYLGKFVNQIKGDDHMPRPAPLPRHLQLGGHRPAAREAHREDHRRVLGADHRGRRQLQHVHLPPKGRRAGAGGADRHLDHVHDPPGGAEV